MQHSKKYENWVISIFLYLHLFWKAWVVLTVSAFNLHIYYLHLNRFPRTLDKKVCRLVKDIKCSDFNKISLFIILIKF